MATASFSVTDRIAAYLKRIGFGNILVHLGETYGGGVKPTGEPWRAGIDGTGETADLSNSAIATSGAPGGPQFGHLFHPRTGRPAQTYKSVSVLAPTATVADALSTAFCLMERDDIARVLGRYQRVAALAVSQSGQIYRF